MKIRSGHISKNKNDCIQTPEWVASDLIRYFQPSGRILEPCRGDGAIYKHMPDNSLWCEILEGRDFFDFNERVDWIITNPPYSKIRKFFKHSMTICDDIVFLIPVWRAFTAEGFFRDLEAWQGGIREVRRYGTGGKLNFPMGNAIGAVYISKRFEYTKWTKYEGV